MSEDQSKTSLDKKSSNKTLTSTTALISVLLVEFILFAFYPFVFLVIIPYKDFEPYPENFCEYHDGKKKVVLTKNVRFTNYLNWKTDEKGDGSKKLRIPKGSTIEVSRVNMHNYPKEPAYIGISFYYDENGKGYTLWDNISLDWIEEPEQIIRDLDAIRAAEEKNTKGVIARTGLGLIITIVSSAVAVSLTYLIFKKNLARHIVFASVLVMLVYALLFVLGPIGSGIYYSNVR